MAFEVANILPLLFFPSSPSSTFSPLTPHLPIHTLPLHLQAEAIHTQNRLSTFIDSMVDVGSGEGVVGGKAAGYVKPGTMCSRAVLRVSEVRAFVQAVVLFKEYHLFAGNE